jgi:hypothetical protein
MEPVLDGEDRIFTNIQVTPDYKNVLQFIENLKNKLGPDDSYFIFSCSVLITSAR